MGKGRMMAEYIFIGSMALHAVEFYIEAEDKEEAIDRAKSGDYDSHEMYNSEIVTYRIDINSIEENK